MQVEGYSGVVIPPSVQMIIWDLTTFKTLKQNGLVNIRDMIEFIT
jgi:hypothetical protein